jgi:hypothetical protein
MNKVLTLIVALVLASTIITAASACTVSSSPSIVLSPTQGFATTTITGTGFAADKTITITYDGAAQPTVPLTVETGCSGSFSAIISVPNELAVGPHTIAATDSKGDSASAIYTVVDMQGAQGAQGPQGIQGAQGAQGVQGPQGTEGPQGAAGQNGADFNATGNVFLYNGTDGSNGLNGADFNATGNIMVYNGTNGLNGQNGLNGINGTNGVNGKDGTDGKDGTNGTNGASGDTQKVVYVNTPKNTYLEYLLILAAVMVACTVTMVACFRKWNKKKTA